MKFSSFTGANFTGTEGQTFHFQTLGDDGSAIGKVRRGQIKRIFRQGRQICVELLIPALQCTHTYEAKRIYFKGW